MNDTHISPRMLELQRILAGLHREAGREMEDAIRWRNGHRPSWLDLSTNAYPKSAARGW